MCGGGKKVVKIMKAKVLPKPFLAPLQKDGEICPTLRSSLSEVGKE